MHEKPHIFLAILAPATRPRRLRPPAPVSVPTKSPPRDATVDAGTSVGGARERATHLPEAAERPYRRVREWVRATRSARSRILIAYVVLLALAGALGLFGFRQFLIVRLENDVDAAMRQEMQELDRLVTAGRDPETGRPFATLEALFDVYFARNVPSRGEAFLGFVEGALYRSSTLARFPLDRLPREALADWEALASVSPGEEQPSTGEVSTNLGTAYFRAARIRFHNELGAFVVTILPAREREEIRNFVTYGGALSLAVLLLASACAWLIAGRVLRPVALLTETARSISQSDLTRRIDVDGTGEAADMARSFNAMLDRLEAVFQSQREFVRDVNHELRDPLTIARGHLQLLDDDPEKRERTVKLIFDELERMGALVDDLRLLAEADQPGFLRLDWIDLSAFTHELISKASSLDSREWVIDRVGEGMLFADRHRLTEAVMNLAHNAVKHTIESDTVAIGTSAVDGEVHISVRDTGTGISAADQEVIFNRFIRGAEAHQRYPGGGLGLAIVKAIAEAHGGRVDLMSRLGEGSTFTIVVPRQAAEGAGAWHGS
jgi:two-component system OmpR family sensor kinase